MALRGRGRWVDVLLLIIFLVIIYIFVIRRNYMSKVNTVLENHVESVGVHNERGFQPLDSPKLVPEKARDSTKEEKDQARISEILDHVPDSRSEACKAVTHDGGIPASIILDFFDYSFYDLRVTISSILRFTPNSLISEIIVIDDGSTLDHIIKEAKLYVDKVPKAVLLRNEDREGQGKARIRGAKEAMGANLIFIDCNAIVSPGWLEPLLEFIHKEKTVIAMPHLDRVNDPVSYEYHKMDTGVAASLNWGLEVIMTWNRETEKDRVYSSPVIRGSIFALTKDYFNEIGGLDSYLSDGGGDVLELSVRTWLCGGAIKVVPCSRVGLLNYHEPQKIISNKNKWRITELWLLEFKDLIQNKAGKDLSSSVVGLDKTSLDTRKHDLEKVECENNIRWYFDNIAKDIFIPPANTKIQGFLQIKNGHCARVGRDMKIDLGGCTPDKYKLLSRDFTFVLTVDGFLKVGNKCLGTLSSAYMVAGDCNPEDDHQKWTYDDNKLVNSWSKFCAMHVTDPDPNLKSEKRQIVMAQKCEADHSKDLEFSSWKFLE